ncbi:hypothetical protein [Saccharothrix deserti]|uniref:hypothetical protein n=1 Tax=Saccharothrix deserti TaxID=2593674 RepID=UPI00131DB7DF|nr:hypothetical protein [Saccharothrix deserti]
MIETAALAGFYAAHGIWSVSEGETLIPILGYEQPDGGRGLDRFMLDNVGDSVRAAQEALEVNEHGAARAALIADAYIHLDTGRTDALIVHAVEYGLTPGSIELAVPYRPHTDSSRFTVYRLQIMEVTGFENQDYDALAEAFFNGVDSHEQAAAVWNAHLDHTA